MLGSIGMQELNIIGVIAMLIFGPKRLPQIGRSMGEAIREFRGIGQEIVASHEEDDRDS